jgi:hypothetical protein
MLATFVESLKSSNNENYEKYHDHLMRQVAKWECK